MENEVNITMPELREDEENEPGDCLICLKNDGDIIAYNHTCGRYWIHRHCAIQWFMEHPNECLVCREQIFNDEEMQSIDNEARIIRNEIRRPTEIVRSNNTYPVVYIPNNRTTYCPSDPCLNICILFIVIMVIYNLLVYTLK